MKTLLVIIILSLGFHKAYGYAEKQKIQKTPTKGPITDLVHSRVFPLLGPAIQLTIADSATAPAMAPATEQTSPPKGYVDRAFINNFYELLMAEFASHRNDPEFAFARYMGVARRTRDVNITKQALKLASLLGDEGKLMEVAQLWHEIDPSSVEARQFLVPLLIWKGDIDGVIENLKMVVKTMDSPREGFDFVVDALSGFLNKKEQEKTVISVMEKLVAYYEGNTEAQVAQAKLFARAERFDEALKIVRSATLSDPENEDFAIFHAQLYKRIEEDQKAFGVLAEFLKRNPDSSKARLTHALMLVDVERYDQAHEEFNELIRRDPENDDARHSFGLLLLRTNQTYRASQQFERLVDSESEHLAGLAHYYLGQIAESKGKPEAAIASYQKIPRTQKSQEYWLGVQISIARLMVETDSLKSARNFLHKLPRRTVEEAVDIYHVEAELLEDAEDYNGAIAVYKQAIGDFPENLSFIYAYVTIAQKGGSLDIDIVESSLRNVLSHEPSNIEVLNFLGYTLTEYTDRYEEAYELIKRAIDLDPQNEYVVDSMGWVLYRMGRHEEALGHLQRAISLLPSAEVAAHLGEVLWVLGKKVEARKVWNDALKEEPDDEYLLKTIKRLDPVYLLPFNTEKFK